MFIYYFFNTFRSLLNLSVSNAKDQKKSTECCANDVVFINQRHANWFEFVNVQGLVDHNYCYVTIEYLIWQVLTTMVLYFVSRTEKSKINRINIMFTQY